MTLFSPSELDQIKQAVQQAETYSGGEIVPVLARQSSFYEIALWRAGFLFASVTSIILTLLYLFTDALLWMPPYLWLLVVMVAGLLGAILVILFPAFKRSLLSREMLKARVLDQAKNMFYDHQVTLTAQRTGVLLFISFFEHQVVILADVGIDELVVPQTWQTITDQLTTGLQQGKRVESINEAIAACGRLLEESGVQRAVDDDNELSNEVRL